MEVHKTYKQRLLLTPVQTKLCEISAGIVRQVYNLALEQRILAYRFTRTSLNYYDQAGELKELKQAFAYIRLAHRKPSNKLSWISRKPLTDSSKEPRS